MNTFFKVLLVIAAVLGALWWLAVGLLNWTAGAQTRSALDMLNTSDEVTIDADQIRLYLDGAGLRNLRVTNPAGDRLTIAEARVGASLWPLLWGRELDIRQITVRGLVFEPGEEFLDTFLESPSGDDEPATPAPADDGRSESPAGEPTRQRPFTGLLQGGQPGDPEGLPVRIRKAEVDGTLLLPDDQRVALRLTLRDFGPAREALVEGLFEASLANLEFPIREARIRSESRLRTHPNGLPQSVEGRAWISLLTRETGESIDLQVELSARGAESGEDYVLRVLREGVETALVDFHGQWNRAAQQVEGRLHLGLTETAVRGMPAWQHLRLPVAEGTLEFTTSSAPGASRESFRLNGSADLPVLVDLLDEERRGKLLEGTIAAKLEGWLDDEEARIKGTLGVENLRTRDHERAPFGAVHQTRMQRDEAGLRVTGPVDLSGPLTTSRGQLVFEDLEDGREPLLRLELDRFDDREWAPVLDLLPELNADRFVVKTP
ncbi:MAG TPA: hypothetical protein VK855_00600 [Thioalkalivibrio sp.]|nr:hypothetical protein [Thioalkalivibrio sp.]